MGVSLLFVGAATMMAEIPPVPRPAPRFTVHFPAGGAMLLSSLKGKVAAILFVHTTCPHCQHTSQIFSRLYAEFGSRGFEPVDVAFNPMASMLVPDFVKDFGITYPTGYGTDVDVLNFLGIPIMERYVVPQIVWLDRKGNIRSQTNPVSGDDKLRTESYWREMIETLLKEPAQTTSRPATPHHAQARK